MNAGLSSLEGRGGMPWHPKVLADQLTLSQPMGTDYSHQIVMAPPGFQTFRRPWNVGLLACRLDIESFLSHLR